jgi:hypothetical protein
MAPTDTPSRLKRLVAGFALVAMLVAYVALVRTFGVGLGNVLFGGLCAPFVLLTYIIKGILVPLAFGQKCPACGERSLAYIGCIAFGYRYHQCSGCGRRFKRCDTLDPWEDASGLGDVEFYRAKPKRPSLGLELRRAAAFVLLLLGVFFGGAIGYWAAGERGSLVGFSVGWGAFVLLERKRPISFLAPQHAVWDYDLDR